MEGKSNIVLVVVLIAIIVGVIVYAQKQKAKPTTTPTDKDKTKPPPVVPPKPKDEAKCWKRHTGDNSAFTLSGNANWITSEFLAQMYQKGNTNDYISLAAAFLKGMDLPLTVAKLTEYKTEFDAFRKVYSDKIIRRSEFLDEVREQTFSPSDLVCTEMVGLAFLR